MNNFFAKSRSKLIPSYESCLASMDASVDRITNIIVKYKEHPFIIPDKNTYPCQSFSFETADKVKMLKKFKTLSHLKLQKKVIYLQKLSKKMLTCLLISYFLALMNVSMTEVLPFCLKKG